MSDNRDMAANHEPISLSPNVSIIDALEMMRRYGLRHFPICDEKSILGLISEADINENLSPAKPKTATVDEIMKKSISIVPPHTTISKVCEIMLNRREDCVIIAEDKGPLLGVFTTTDALKLIKNSSNDSPVLIDA